MAPRKKTSQANKPPAEALSWITPDLHALAVPLEGLVSDPQNARLHDEQSYLAISASLEKFGQVKPIVCNKRNNQVEAGNGTLEAARRMGKSYIAVVWVDHDPATQHGFAIADNRTAEFSAWDQSRLDELIGNYSSDWGDDLYDALELENLILTDEPEETTASPAATAAYGEAAGGTDPAEDPKESSELPPEVNVKRSWQVVIDCIDEDQQEAIYTRLAAEGLKCRVLTL